MVPKLNSPDIRVVRSGTRTRTVSIREVDGILEVRAPLDIDDAELQRIIVRLRTRLERRKDRKTRQAALDDAYLRDRAQTLNSRHFGGTLSWASITWSLEQDQRWGSCTRQTRTMRISHRLAVMPEWVLDAVIVHELAHLVEGNHGPRFWDLANRYPLMERARGYLMAISVEGEMAM